MAVTFFLQNSAEAYFPFDDAIEAVQWIGNVTPSINTTFADPHGSVMQVSTATITGAARLFSVEPGVKYVLEAEYRSAGTVKFVISDVTNAGIIVSNGVCAASTPHWSNYYHEETLASNCTQIRVYIWGAPVTHTAYIDNIRFQGNALLQDPEIGQDSYNYQDNSKRHEMLDGSVKVTRIPRRLGVTFNFPYLMHTQFTRLQEFVNDGQETWLDDGAVPNGIDEGYVYNDAEDDFTDTTNNKAYWAGSQTLSAWATLFETSGTAFTAAQYAAIDADDSNYASLGIVNTSDYEFNKFSIAIPATQISTLSEVQSLDVVYKGSCYWADVESDGLQLFLWDGVKYIEVDSGYGTHEKLTLAFNTTKPSVAQRFVNASGATLYIRALVRTVASAASTAVSASIIDTYYFRTIVNENLSATIPLKEKAILSSTGDVVSVQNVTRGSALTLGTSYRVAEDRQSIICTGSPTVGDKIQVEYAKYHRVIPTEFSENRVESVAATGPGRGVSMGLESVSTM